MGVTERWQFEASDTVFSSATVVEDTVYVGSRDNNLYALARSDGTERWRFETGEWVTATPAVYDDIVYLGNRNGTLFALDAGTGEELWERTFSESIISSPAVVDETVYTQSTTGTIYAVDRVNGRTNWTVETAEGGFSSPAVVEGSVYIGSNDGHVYALDPEDGTERWRFETESTVDSSPAVVDGTVYVGSDDQRVYAIDAETGNDNWQFETGARVFSTPTVADGTVYIGSHDATVYALDSATGEETWRFDTGGPVVSSPVVVGNAVLVGSDDGHLYALDASEGTVIWQFETEAEVMPTPTVVDGAVYIGDATGTIYALGIDQPPDVTVEVTPENPRPGERITLTATVADPESDRTPRFQWDFTDDGSIDGTGRTVTHTFADSGTYTIRLVVMLDDRQVSAVKQQITIDSAETTVESQVSPGEETTESSPSDVSGGVSTTTQSSLPTETGGSVISDVPGGGAGVGLFGLAAFAGGALAWSRWSGTESEDNLSAGTDGATADAPTDEKIASSVAGGAQDHDQHQRQTRTYHTSGRPPDEIPRVPEIELTYEEVDIGDRIGAGGNADVNVAVVTHEGVDQRLAIKRPRFEGTIKADLVDRFLREAETWNELDGHDNIVGVVDWGSSPTPWIALEYMDGGDLGDWSGEMDVPQALWTSLSVLRGVRHAHDYGVAHLDLKPENVLFRKTGSGEWPVPKVGDWGLAKLLLKHSMSMDQLSPRYAAPEQFDSETYGTPDKRTDIYQLGAVFYELFTGHPPVTGDGASVMYEVLEGEIVPPTELQSNLPPAIDDVLLTALSKQKTDRYESVLYLRDELNAIYESIEIVRE